MRVGKDILQTAGKSAAESAADGVIDNLTNGDSDNSQRCVPSQIRSELLLTVKADALSRGSRTMLLQKQVVFLAERLLTLSERAATRGVLIMY